MENIEDIIREVREKIRNNPKYVNPMSREFQEDIKKYGFENGNKYINWMIQNKILKIKSDIEYNRESHRKVYESHGCKTATEYANLCAQKLGYKDRKERRNEYEWANGIRSPISKNKDHHSYSGVEIAQKKVARIILPMILGEIKQEMGHNNPGFDFLMEGDIKVDVKSGKLRDNAHLFQICHNSTADCFLLIGFNYPYDDIKLDVLHVWFYKSKEMVRKRIGTGWVLKKFYDRTGFQIINNEEELTLFGDHELKKEFEEFKKVCINLEEDIDD